MLDFSKTLSANAPLVHPSSLVRNCQLGGWVEVGDHCVLEETTVGDYTYFFGYNDVIFAAIGKFNSIATGVRINPVQHPAKIRAAAHHFTYRRAHYQLGEDDGRITEWRRENRVSTGHDVWLGHNAVIMGGVNMGDGAVAAAGAVVTRSVEPYEIVGGVPARHLGWRYEKEIIAALERIRWWEWSHEELRERMEDFNDAARFCAKYDPGV